MTTNYYRIVRCSEKDLSSPRDSIGAPANNFIHAANSLDYLISVRRGPCNDQYDESALLYLPSSVISHQRRAEVFLND